MPYAAGLGSVVTSSRPGDLSHDSDLSVRKARYQTSHFGDHQLVAFSAVDSEPFEVRRVASSTLPSPRGTTSSAWASVTGAPWPRRWAIRRPAQGAPVHPADRHSDVMTGTARIGIFCEPSAAIWASRWRIEAFE